VVTPAPLPARVVWPPLVDVVWVLCGELVFVSACEFLEVSLVGLGSKRSKRGPGRHERAVAD